jgi:hypothetical protein
MANTITRWSLLFLLVSGSLLFRITAQVPTPLFIQPPATGGGFFQSSSNGTDNDQYVWDDFTLTSAATIAEIGWFGVFDPAKSGSGGPVTDFQVSIYASIAGGAQPDVVSTPLMQARTGGNAGETPAGQSGGTTQYLYYYILPAAFHADSGKKYWLQIEAFQSGVPDWGIAAATGGSNSHFRRMSNGVDFFYQAVPGDLAFILLDQAVSIRAGQGVNMHLSNPLFPVRVAVSGSSFTFTFPQEIVGGVFSLTDLLGRTFFSGQLIRSTKMTLENRHPTSGTFIIVISQDGEKYVRKLLVPFQ